MRDLKFRGYDFTKKIMIPFEKIRPLDYVYDSELDSMFYAMENHLHIMQYTGLKIKDKEIYEGDIIKARNDYSYKVVFENGSFVLYHLNKYADVDMVRWGLLGRLFDSDMRDILDKCEIIGNIYENPEL